MAEIVQQRKEELRVHHLVVATDLALKTQLIDAFEEMYFSSLRNRHRTYRYFLHGHDHTSIYQLRNNFGYRHYGEREMYGHPV